MKTIRSDLFVSTELNEKLEQLAVDGNTTKSDLLRKAIALFDVVLQAKAEKKRFGILDQDKQLLTEIVSI